MTNLEALRSTIEYQNDDLFGKVLIDNGLNAEAEYTSGSKKNIDLALADVYLYLATHPEEREGAWSVKYDTARLRAARREIYNRHGLTPPEITNATTSGAQVINGERIW